MIILAEPPIHLEKLKSYNEMININLYTNKNNRYSSPTFMGQRLFSLNLRNNLKPDEFIPAFFTRLDNEEDLTLLNSIQNLWKNTTYWKKIYTDFQETLLNKKHNNINRFFMIECPQFKDFNQQIRALSKTNDTNSELYVSYLQSASEIPELEKLNGAGLGIMRGLCKLAQQEKQPQIGLVSPQKTVGFYNKIGLTQEQSKLNDCSTYKFSKDKSFFSYNSVPTEKIRANCFYGFHLSADSYDKFLEKTKIEYGDIIPVKE